MTRALAVALAGTLAGCAMTEQDDSGIAVSSALTISNLGDASVRIEHRVSRADSIVVVAIATKDPEPQSHVVGDQTGGDVRVLDLLVSHQVGDVQIKLFARAYNDPGLRLLNVTSGGGLDQLIIAATVTGAATFGATGVAGERSDRAVVETPAATGGDLVLGIYAGDGAEIDGISSGGTQHHVGDFGVGRALFASAPGDEPLAVTFSEAQDWAAGALVFTP